MVVWKDPITEYHDPTKMLHQFHTAQDLAQWDIIVDSTYGGMCAVDPASAVPSRAALKTRRMAGSSEATLTLSPDGKAVFEGTLSTKINGDVLKKSGFCGIRCNGRQSDTNLAYYNALVIRACAP